MTGIESVVADPLRILHVIPAVAPRYGGPSEMVLGACQQLQARGHRITLLTSSADGAGDLPVPHDDSVDYRGVATRFFRRRWGEAFKIAPGMGRWLRSHASEYDLVHIHAVFSWSTLVAGRICLARGIPYIVRPLGSLDPWSMRRKRRLKRLLLGMGLGRILRGAAGIHYTSELERQAAEAGLGLARGRVVPNAVMLPELPLPPARSVAGIRRPYLLSMGRLDPKKKLDTVIRSFAGIMDQTPLQLVIAGDGDAGYRRLLEHTAANCRASDRIHFTGWIDGPDKEALLAACEAFVLVSENENFGIAAVESMAHGKPVLVNTGVYLHPDIARSDCGWVIAEDGELAAAMLAIGRDPDGCRAKGNNARTMTMDRYSWDAVIPSLEAMYRHCLADSGK